MKKHISRLITLAAAALAVISLGSCLSDDDNNNTQTLTPQQQLSAQASVQGLHSGQCTFAIDSVRSNGNYASDTTHVTWNCRTDSSLVIHDMPISAMGQFVNDPDLKAAILALPDADLQCQYYAYNTTPMFVVNAYTLQRKLTVGGVEKTVNFVFYANSYGYMQLNQGKQYMQLLLAAIYADGDLQTMDANQTFLITEK